MSLVQPSPTELESYVFNGVWRRYDEGQLIDLKWTLGNLYALFVMIGVALVIALAQTQCWAMLRYIIAQYKKPIQLEDALTQEPLLKLSQGEAIKIFLPWLSENLLARIRRRERNTNSHNESVNTNSHNESVNTNSHNESVESPLFGFASIMVILVFFLMGAGVPYWLTESALGAPIVKSKITEDCIISEEPEHLLDVWNRETRADDIFKLCGDELDGGCDSPYWLSKPQITKTRPTTCPFEGGICVNNTPSFQITHWNISAFEMGVSSRSKLQISHRLTCSPISLDPFLWKYPNGSVIYIQQLQFDTMVRPNVSLFLSTKNGPNKFSKESSGALMYNANGPWDLTVLPLYLLGANQYEPLKLNKLLQRNDARPFLAIHRAGNAKYINKIDDPFFSAHNIIGPTNWTSADYEATGLGCAEQFQYCFAQSQLPTYCTDWGTSNDIYSQMFTYLWTHYIQANEYDGRLYFLMEHSNDQYIISINEMANLFQYFESRFGVYVYLSMRIEYHKMVPLRQRKSGIKKLRWLDDDSEQWTFEVETWLMKAYLSGILTVQDGAMFSKPNLTKEVSPEYSREWKLCGRILFHNQDFTNINWIGFWITIVSLVLLTLIGNQVERLHQGLICCGKRLRSTKQLVEDVWHRREHERQANQILNMTFLFQFPNRARRWYSSNSTRQNETSDDTEMGDLEVNTDIHTDSGSSTEMEDVELNTDIQADIQADTHADIHADNVSSTEIGDVESNTDIHADSGSSTEMGEAESNTDIHADSGSSTDDDEYWRHDNPI